MKNRVNPDKKSQKRTLGIHLVATPNSSFPTIITNPPENMVITPESIEKLSRKCRE